MGDGGVRKSYRARMVVRVSKRDVPEDEQKLPEKNVYGAESRIESANRYYRLFNGVDSYRPIVMGFQRNEVNGGTA
jgi:hypothetical protein